MDTISPGAVDLNPPVTTRTVALERVFDLSEPQAHEIWRAMHLIATNGSVHGLSGAAVELARDLNHFLQAWKAVAEKALVHERNTTKRKG